MKKAKRNAIIGLIVFLLLVAGGIYIVLYGIGSDKSGKASDIPLGLDLQGGVSVTYEIEEDNATDEQVNATIDKLQRRVDNYSPDGSVYKQGKNRITVEIPLDTSKYDPNDVLDAMGRPGKLEFLDPENYQKWAALQASKSSKASSTDASATDASATDAYTAALSGSDISNAEAGRTQDSTTGAYQYIVSLKFTDEGAKKFETVTGNNIGKPVYIIYDGQVVSAPTVQQKISGGSAQIDGQKDYDEAETLASTIKSGALPLTLNELSSQVVGAQLGSNALHSSIIAGIIGLGIIFLIMIIVFRFPGFLASIALCVYTIMELFFLNTMHITLTLPGIAGIILSIGMAVDANVIIFTRIKEEIGNGVTVKTAVKTGFSKALSAIIDGNVTTVIAGIVLLIMGTGTVKGFARTLILGIVLSMVSALFITKFLLNIFVNLGAVNKKLYGSVKYKRVGKYSKIFPYTLAFSLIVIVTGIVFLFVNPHIEKRGKALNYSLEFSGGTSTSVTFNENYTLSSAEKKIIPVIAKATGVSAGTIQVQTVNDSNQIVFKSSVLDEAQRKSMTDALESNFKLTDDKIETQNISSTISSETRRDAILAVAIAAVLMLIYVAFRFSDVRFGVSAVLALVHDVMFVFFAYSVAYLSVGGTFIACMLTIVGYSINSTIVIFDRVRENLKAMDVKKIGYDELVNTSISQTFTRNIYTNLTTFVTVFVLFIMGVASLKEFTLTLMVGIVAGTYSSICITGPLWLTLRKHIGSNGLIVSTGKKPASKSSSKAGNENAKISSESSVKTGSKKSRSQEKINRE